MILEDEVRALLDRQAVTDVLHKMCHYIDTFQLDRLVNEVFAPDGWDDHGSGPVVGREALHAWYEDATRNVAATAHNVSNVWVEVSGGRAIMRSTVISWTWTVDAADDDPLHVADYALCVTYVDKLSQYPQGWLVDSRELIAKTSKLDYPTILAVGQLPGSQRSVHALADRRPPLPGHELTGFHGAQE